MWHLTARKISVRLLLLNWNKNEMTFYHISELMLATLIQRYDTLRKHVYSNKLKILQPKKENFQMKKSDIFHIPAQNIDCGYSLEPPWRGGSNEYPQSMFLAK